MLVGRLGGTLNGRPIEITTKNQTATVRLSGLISAMQLRRLSVPSHPVARKLAERAGLNVRVKVRGLPAVRVFPQPGVVGRLLARTTAVPA